MLSGLSKLYKYTGDPEVFKAAENLIDSVIASSLVDHSGILTENGDQSGTTNQDQWMFKGIFFGHLGYFLADICGLNNVDVASKIQLLQKYSNFVHANAVAVWDDARAQTGGVGAWWAAPVGSQVQKYSVETLGSGIAAVLCSVRLDQLLHSLETTTA